MSYGLEALEVLKNRALSDLDSIPKTAIPICEKNNEEIMKNYETIIKDLDRLEKLEKIFSDLKSMFEIKIGIDMENEYFMEIKQLDDRISELIPIVKETDPDED